LSLNNFLTASLDRTVVNLRRPYKYLVYSDPPYYKVIDGASLKLLHKSTDASQEIQYALDQLTPGRDFKEAIVMLGDFTLSQSVIVPSYTKLILEGKVYSEVNPFFKVYGTDDTTKIKCVEFQGGTLESNYPTAYGHGIDLKFTERVKIHDIEFVKLDHGIHSDGTSFESNTFLAIENNYFEDCHEPVWLKWLSHVKVEGNLAQAPQSEPYGCGIKLDLVNNFIVSDNEMEGHDILIMISTASYGTILGNRVSGGRGGGIAITGGCYHIAVVGNEVQDMLKEGIELRRLQYGVVVGNVLHNNGYAGLRLWSDCKYVTLEANTLSDNGHAYVPGSEHPVFAQVTILQEDASGLFEKNTLAHNIFSNRNRTPDYQIYGAPCPGHTTNPGMVYIHDNYFDSVTTSQISYSGPYEARRNIGYLTEDEGVEIQSGDGVKTQFTIAHGLVAEPTLVNVTPLSADASGDFYVTKDGTNIYVNYLTAPPAGTNNLIWSWEGRV
jgi:parallel beta-helix repeat protein